MTILTHRYQRRLLLGVAAVISLYLVLPLAASYLLANELRRQGYQHVIVQLGYPGWRSMRIPVVSFQRDLGHESLLVSLTDAELHYWPLQLARGHVDQVVLPYVAVQILNTAALRAGDGTGAEAAQDDGSPWALLTASDLLRRLPILPVDELRLDRVTLFRERATGPLRKVTISGVVVQQEGELGGHLTFQGQETASYGLTVAGHSASTWSATLASQRPQAPPIVSWQSHAQGNGSQIRMEGRLEVNVRELAPFIALLVPIGPELGRVTGQVAMNWTGTVASDVSLLSMWEDPRTQFAGQIHAAITLPALHGVAKDISVAGDGLFAADATQVRWTIHPGVLLTATVNVQPTGIPELVRTLLPRGDQPVWVEQRAPVHGWLYWGETPFRMTAEGPLQVTYGRTNGPLVAEFEAVSAEANGWNLVAAEGRFRVEGELSEAMTRQLFAREAMGGFHGTLTLAKNRVTASLAPSSLVTLKSIEQGPLSIPRATLQLSEELPVQCDAETGRCTAGPASIAVRVPAAHVMGRDLRMTQATLALQQVETAGSAWNLLTTLQAAGVTVDLPASRPVPTEWKVKIAANQAGLKADVRVDAAAHGGVVTARVEQPFGAAPGSLHAQVGPVSFDAGHRLGTLVTALPVSADLTGGTLSLTADAVWTMGVGAEGQPIKLTSAMAILEADKLVGRYQDYLFSGLRVTAPFKMENGEAIVMTQPASLTVTSVQTGVEITNLAVALQAFWKWGQGWPVVDIRDVQGDLFGGEATSPGLRLDWSKPPHQITFSLRKLDLAKILSVEQQKGLQGSGILNGTLPITITPAGVRVEGGTLEAQAPGGVIRYGALPESPKLITEADSHLHLVSQALNNFHYTVLRVGVDYAETGALDLSVRLEGRNPDMKKSPPIHFNLAVQEHVPTLLRSLRLAQDIEDAVQKKYKKPGVL